MCVYLTNVVAVIFAIIITIREFTIILVNVKYFIAITYTSNDTVSLLSLTSLLFFNLLISLLLFGYNGYYKVLKSSSLSLPSPLITSINISMIMFFFSYYYLVSNNYFRESKQSKKRKWETNKRKRSDDEIRNQKKNNLCYRKDTFFLCLMFSFSHLFLLILLLIFLFFSFLLLFFFFFPFFFSSCSLFYSFLVSVFYFFLQFFFSSSPLSPSSFSSLFLPLPSDLPPSLTFLLLLHSILLPSSTSSHSSYLSTKTN